MKKFLILFILIILVFVSWGQYQKPVTSSSTSGYVKVQESNSGTDSAITLDFGEGFDIAVKESDEIGIDFDLSEYLDSTTEDCTIKGKWTNTDSLFMDAVFKGTDNIHQYIASPVATDWDTQFPDSNEIPFAIWGYGNTYPMFTINPLDFDTCTYPIIVRVGRRAMITGDSKTLIYASDSIGVIDDVESQGIYSVMQYNGQSNTVHIAHHGMAQAVSDDVADTLAGLVGGQFEAHKANDGAVTTIMGLSSTAETESVDENANSVIGSMIGGYFNVLVRDSSAVSSAYTGQFLAPTISNNGTITNAYAGYFEQPYDGSNNYALGLIAPRSTVNDMPTLAFKDSSGGINYLLYNKNSAIDAFQLSDDLRITGAIIITGTAYLPSISVGGGAATAQIAWDISGTDGTLTWNGTTLAINGAFDASTNITGDSLDLNSGKIDQLTINAVRVGGDSIAEFNGDGLDVSGGQLNVDDSLYLDTLEIIATYGTPSAGQVAKYGGTDQYGRDSTYWAADATGAGWNWGDSSSHGPDSVLYADEADSAGKASADGAGNNIASTYAPIDNPTFTTGITVPNNSISDEELDEGMTATWSGPHTWTGSTNDFGAAGNFEIPNGTNPTVDAVGEIAVDSDDKGLSIYDSTFDVSVLQSNIYSFTLTIPADYPADTIQFRRIDDYKFPHGIKILHIFVQPKDSVAASFSFAEWDDSTQSAWIDTVANTSGNWWTESFTFTDSDIAANHHIRVGFDSLDVSTNITVDYYIKTGD